MPNQVVGACSVITDLNIMATDFGITATNELPSILLHHHQNLKFKIWFCSSWMNLEPFQEVLDLIVLILIGELIIIFQNDHSLKIFRDSYQDTEAFCHYSRFLQKKQKHQASWISHIHIYISNFGKKSQENLEDKKIARKKNTTRYSSSILSRCRWSFNVSIGLDEASCPGRWSYTQTSLSFFVRE